LYNIGHQHVTKWRKSAIKASWTGGNLAIWTFFCNFAPENEKDSGLSLVSKALFSGFINGVEMHGYLLSLTGLASWVLLLKLLPKIPKNMMYEENKEVSINHFDCTDGPARFCRGGRE
jgi:hypothetical protein